MSLCLTLRRGEMAGHFNFRWAEKPVSSGLWGGFLGQSPESQWGALSSYWHPLPSVVDWMEMGAGFWVAWLPRKHSQHSSQKTTLQRAGCAAKSQAPSWSYIHPHMGKNFLASFTRTKSTLIFFFKSGIEEKGGREGKWKEREGGRAMGSMWVNQTLTPWPGRQRHSLLPCSLTVLKNSREGDNTPGKWSV